MYCFEKVNQSTLNHDSTVKSPLQLALNAISWKYFINVGLHSKGYTCINVFLSALATYCQLDSSLNYTIADTCCTFLFILLYSNAF